MGWGFFGGKITVGIDKVGIAHREDFVRLEEVGQLFKNDLYAMVCTLVTR